LLNLFKKLKFLKTCKGEGVWSGVRIDKLIVPQLVNKSPSFMDPEGFVPFSQESDTGPYSEPDEPNQRLHSHPFLGVIDSVA
jgi:hypothetical protein